MKFVSHNQQLNAVLNTFPDAGHFNREKRIHFEMQTLEWMEDNLHFPPDGESRLSDYEIIYFTSGHGFLKVDTDTFQVKDETIFCFVPGQIRRFMLVGQSAGYSIRFAPDFLFTGSANTKMASWLDNYGAGIPVPAIELEMEMQVEIKQIIGALQKEYTNYFLLRSELLSGLLNVLLIHLSRKLQGTNCDYNLSKDNDLVHQFKRLLKKNFLSKKQVVDYADELCVTPNYLNKTVKKVTGFTASYHIQQQIILEAKRQVIHSNGSMKEIAYFLGFDNLAHFSKFFKNNSGMNFTSFRKGLLPTG